MRISDWSSDVCSSDLLITGRHELRYSGSGRVWGVYALDEKTGKVHAHVGRATILASGGAGRVYPFSTAPRGATGDGLAMAWRAGDRKGVEEGKSLCVRVDIVCRSLIKKKHHKI